jgi:hypothetical protein
MTLSANFKMTTVSTSFQFFKEESKLDNAVINDIVFLI